MAKQHGVCALCRKEADLELSHIVPKMVVRELKKTSVGQLRSTENPNGTMQDRGSSSACPRQKSINFIKVL